ncbi:tryptophan synthase subunit alpha [Streptomyces sp. NPDC048734]
MRRPHDRPDSPARTSRAARRPWAGAPWFTSTRPSSLPGARDHRDATGHRALAQYRAHRKPPAGPASAPSTPLPNRSRAPTHPRRRLRRPDTTTAPAEKGTPLATTPPLHTLLAQPRSALGTFVPAGLHCSHAERRHLGQLAHAGTDLFEIGLAHHDAHLDGPVIQHAYRRVLRSGDALDSVVRAVAYAAHLRPTVVMTYWEPVQRHGPESAARLFADAGASGVMIVDLPDHHAECWQAAAHHANLRTPRLVPRRTTDDDLATVATNASGWLYPPASAQPTGYRGPLDIPALAAFTRRLRAASPLPVVSGVGTSTPALAAHVAPLVDAVVIGTPVVRALVSTPEQAPQLVAAFARALASTAATEPRARSPTRH